MLTGVTTTTGGPVGLERGMARDPSLLSPYSTIASNNSNSLNISDSGVTLGVLLDQGGQSEFTVDQLSTTGTMAAYFYLTVTMSILSIFGCVIILATYVWMAEIRSPGRRLLVFLSVADFLTAFGNLLGIVWYVTRNSLPREHCATLCHVQAALTIFSSIASFLWTVSIATHLYVCIVQNNAHLANGLHPYFHIFSWGLPGRCSFYVMT